MKSAPFLKPLAGIFALAFPVRADQPFRAEPRPDPDMTHDPALDAHEQHEHAEHAALEREPFLARVSITIAVLAVLAAAVGSLETVEGGRAITASSEAVLAQDKATDAWNEYQADSLKRHLYGIAADEDAARADQYRRIVKLQQDGQSSARKKALADEADRDRLSAESTAHEARHHWLTGAATLLEIGIALSTVAIITRRWPFWAGALLLGAAGLVLFAAAYLT